MNKRYEYYGKIYCEDDLSESIDNYGGNLYDLFLLLEADDRAERKEKMKAAEEMFEELGHECKYIKQYIYYRKIDYFFMRIVAEIKFDLKKAKLLLWLWYGN